METRLRHDFSDVRLHTDARAQRSATELGARAYTSGNHIVSAASDIDKHTLAHELTHVVQQRQGPVAGTDQGNGLRVSDPSDRYERAAEATATRVMSGGQAELGVPGRSGIPQATGVVQRWAFVNGQLIDKKSPELTKKMQPLADDQLVHDYETMEEFKDHAEGKTEYLGNLKHAANTWVRFSSTGTNVLGENHTETTLPDVLKAVGKASFIYEKFITESLDEKPKTKNAYQVGAGNVFEKFDLPRSTPWTAHGAESLYPKLGFSMALLLPYLREPDNLDELRSGESKEYLGIQMQTSLKIGWKYGKDKRNQQEPKAPEGKLVELYKKGNDRKSYKPLEKNLNKFIEALPDGGSLGDAFRDKKTREKYAEPLKEYVTALINELQEQVAKDPLAPEDPGSKNLDGQESYFSRLRNRHLWNSTEKALGKKVRYVGMGLDHAGLFEQSKNKKGSGLHFYDMTSGTILGSRGNGLREFMEFTKKRAEQAGNGNSTEPVSAEFPDSP